MTLNHKLQKKQYEQIWQQYCGFLDLSIPEYMEIQNRLMLEQIELYANCELGQHIMNGKKPTTIDEFRQTVPLTVYEDYADILLQKIESALPSRPLLWIETTWEGGKNPIKVAPYTESMISCHRNNFLACMILATSNKKGHFTLRGKENFLYGMAPLPYLTGIVPHVISGELTVNFLPATKDAEKMSFSQRNKAGFKMGLQKGIDLFFGLSSVILKMSEAFVSGNSFGNRGNMLRNSPKMNYRLIRAWLKSKKEKRPIMPKDIWHLKGLICAGTDTMGTKKKIEEYWGVKPLEIFGGTEPTCIATETWNKNGLILFPDVCFYEFIPLAEMQKNIENPAYIPNTYLLDELVAGNEYELVISNLKGGAFVRYRAGDIFKCLSLADGEDGVQLPRFAYIDRDPRVIDIGGFTRISETTINEALTLSKLPINEWFAVKEYDKQQKAFLHLYVEVTIDGIGKAITKDIIKEHLSIYFRYVDSDYQDLKSLLGADPLKVSIIPAGTIRQYENIFGYRLQKMNPSHYEIIDLLKIARRQSNKEGI